MPGRRGRGEHDVDLAELSRHLVEAERRAAEARGELGGRLGGPVGDVGDRGAARREVPRRELADAAGTDEEHLAAA